MMMMSPKKKAATLIVGMMAKPKDSSDPADFVDRGDAGEPDDKQVALDAIAEDILKAVTQKNPKALSAALSHFWYICDEDDEALEESESEPQE